MDILSLGSQMLFSLRVIETGFSLKFVILLVESLGAKDLNKILRDAVYSDPYDEIFHYLVSKGADDFNGAMID